MPIIILKCLGIVISKLTTKKKQQQHRGITKNPWELNMKTKNYILFTLYKNTKGKKGGQRTKWINKNKISRW